jgi:hypothetical protein
MLSCNRWLRRCFAVVGGVRLLSPPPLCEAHAVVALSACDATKASSTLGVGGAPVCTSKNRAYSSSDTRDDSASRAVAVAGRASAAAAAAPPARGWEGFRAVGCSHGAFHRPATHLAWSAGAPAHSSASEKSVRCGRPVAKSAVREPAQREKERHVGAHGCCRLRRRSPRRRSSWNSG